MAKGFKRYAKGGRFKPNDISDGGLGEYRRQQREILDALKLQQARTDEYRKEFSRESEGVAKREAQNTELLQDLENRAWETRRRAVEVRGKREVEALEGKAKEYEKESKFWMDFAPKFSKGLAQTAVGIKDYLDKKTADDNLTAAIANGNFTILHENIDKNIKKNGKSLFNLKQEAYRTGDTDAIDWITSLEKSGYDTQIAYANHIEKNIDSFGAEVKDIVAQDPELNWNSKYIKGYYLVRAKEYIKKFNLQGAAANKVIAAFHRAGIAAKMEAQRIEIGQKQDATRNQYLQTVVLGKGTKENPTNMQNLVNSFRHGFKIQGNNYVPVISTDVNAAAIEAMKAIASTGKYTFDQAWELISNTNIPDQPGPVQTTFAQHEATKKVSTLRSDSEQAFSEGAAIAAQRTTNLKKHKDNYEELKNDVVFAKDGEIGSLENTNEFYEKTVARYETLVKEGNDNAATEIADKHWFINPDTINEKDKILNLIRESNSGDARGVLHSYRQLSEKARKLVPKELIEGAEVLNAMFPDTSGKGNTSTKVLEEYVNGKLVQYISKHQFTAGLTKSVISKSAERMSPVVQAMYTSKMLEMMPLYKTETGYNISGLRSGLDKELIEMLNSDQGILQKLSQTAKNAKSNENNSITADSIVEYILTSGNEMDTRITPDRDIARVIQEELKVPGKAVIKTIKNGTTIHTLDENLLKTIHPGELRTSAVDIVTGRLEGKTITIPRAIHVIYHQLGGAYTKTELLNMALKQSGYNEQVLDGQHEILKTKKLNFWSKGDDDTLGAFSSVITQPNRKFNFKDVRPEDTIPNNIFLDAYSQSGTKPVSLANRPYTFENINGGDIFTEQLKLVGGDRIDFNELVVDWDDKGSYMDFVGTKLKGVEDRKFKYSKEYFDFFVKNRHKLGVEIIPLDNGGFRFRTKHPALATPISGPEKRSRISEIDRGSGPPPERTLPKITRDDRRNK